MKTLLIPQGEAFEALVAVKTAIKDHDAKCAAVTQSANEQLTALQLEYNRKTPELWARLAHAMGMTVEELRRHYVDFTYVDEHRLAFLRELPQEHHPAGLAPSVESTQVEAARSLQ